MTTPNPTPETGNTPPPVSNEFVQDGCELFTSGEWLNGYHQALEDAAKMVESHRHTIHGTLSPLTGKNTRLTKTSPRQLYADAIRAMKDKGL